MVVLSTHKIYLLTYHLSLLHKLHVHVHVGKLQNEIVTQDSHQSSLIHDVGWIKIIDAIDFMHGCIQ